MGQTKTQAATTTEGQTAPWAVQQPYLEQAFQGAQGALGQAQANGGNAPSQFTAQFTPEMMNAFRQELGYGTSNLGTPMGSSAAAGAANSAGSDAIRSGLTGLAGFNPTGGTDYNIAAANKYADAGSGAIPGMVAGAMRDANQNFNDVTAPALMRGASASGNINSTAPSIQSGIVQRGLAQQAGDLSAQFRGQLYNTGLNLGQSQATADNSARLAALSGAAQGGAGAINSGTYAGTGSVGQARGLFDIANAGASNLNAGNQAPLTNQMQGWQFGQQAPFTPWNNFMNLIGNRQWGGQNTGQTNTTQTQTPSPMQMIGGGLGILGGLF